MQKKVKTMSAKKFAAKAVAQTKKYVKRYKRRLGGNISGLQFVNKFTKGNPFPEFQFKKMTYSGTHTMTVGSSGLMGSIQRYKINAMYDTDESGSGHQPAGFDVMASIYKRYKVNGVRVTLRVYDPETIDFITLGYMLTNPSNPSESIANQTVDDVTEKQQSGTVLVSGTGNQYKEFKFFLPINKVAGVTKLQFKADPDNFTAVGTGDPGNLCKFQFAAADPKGGSSGSVKVNIILDYYVMWYNRIVLAQS